jgi:nucleoside-diphosphate-sugar epimerase
MAELDVVTGAFSFTGRFIAEELLSRGRRVRTLTRREPDASHALSGKVEAAPLVFDDSLRESLAGADTLYNTYWVRLERGSTTFDRAVENTATLFRAAKDAGVRRVVHISVANSSPTSPYPYFQGKARGEEALRETGLSHAIIRPALVYGPGDIVVNNLAWVLRHAPVFLVPGDGRYEVQPVSVHDVARLCAEAGAREDDTAFDAAGPERLAFLDFVRLIKTHAHGRAWIRTAPVAVAHTAGALAGLALRDVIATRDELDATVAGLLSSQEPPLGRDRLRDWLEENGETLGRTYASDLKRHFRDER